MSSPKGKRILIVDDEERNLKLVGLLLAKDNYAYKTALSGHAALELMQGYQPDLVG